MCTELVRVHWAGALGWCVCTGLVRVHWAGAYVLGWCVCTELVHWAGACALGYLPSCTIIFLRFIIYSVLTAGAVCVLFCPMCKNFSTADGVYHVMCIILLYN